MIYRSATFYGNNGLHSLCNENSRPQDLGGKGSYEILLSDTTTLLWQGFTCGERHNQNFAILFDFWWKLPRFESQMSRFLRAEWTFHETLASSQASVPGLVLDLMIISCQINLFSGETLTSWVGVCVPCMRQTFCRTHFKASLLVENEENIVQKIFSFAKKWAILINPNYCFRLMSMSYVRHSKIEETFIFFCLYVFHELFQLFKSSWAKKKGTSHFAFFLSKMK